MSVASSIPQLRELSLIHFGSKHLSSMVRDWASANPFAALESCARQVWVGNKDTFSDFPYNKAGQEVSLLEGADAYKFALELLSGLKSEKVGENHIVRQFREKWEQFQQEHPELEYYLRPFKDMLEKDVAQIRAKVIDHVLPYRHQKAMQLVSGQTKGDRVLVIGHMTRTGEPNDDMKDTIQFLGNNRNGRPLVNEIAIMTSSINETQDVVAWIKIHQNQRRIHPDITVNAIKREDMGIAVEVYNRMYMTSTIGKNPELEAVVKSAWEQRMRKDNTLTLLRGKPELRGNTPEEWKNEGMKASGVRVAEDIWNMMGKIKEHNARLVELSQEMISFCCSARDMSTNPSYKDFRVDKSSLSLQMP